MVLRHVDNAEKYLELLRSDTGEIRALYEDILINVTEFFRDPEVFAALRDHVFPQMIERHRLTGNRSIRFWIPGCSTGEEVYSLGIVLLEFLGDRINDYTVQIFATDISETALEKARSGIYPPGIAQNVSSERLRRFFVRADSGYQIHKRVREICIFARHNLTKDPPFSRLDLISCRNLLIYLGPVLQERVIPVLHYALGTDGILVLGASESIGAHQDLFLLIDKKHKIYSRKPAPVRLSLDYSLEPMAAYPAEARRRPAIWTEIDLQREADRIVINKFGPPGVVIDEDENIVQFRGQTSQFLEPASGTASLNLLRMLKEGLAVSVKKAIADSRKRNQAIRREGIPLPSDGLGFINLEVIPFRRELHRDRRFLVLFEKAAPAPPAAKAGKSQKYEFLQTENQHLQQELASTKEYLQSIIEDQEAAQEELRSAAEEIQSSNEELQSTNEELETAKEELQSSNEELNTVNEELQTRNLQLSMVGNDLMNLLANVSIPILILGNDLRIRRFTPITEKALNLIPSDAGRPLRDLNLRIKIPDLEHLLADVLENLAPRSLEVSDPDGRHYSLRVRPYRTEDNKIDGLVMVFIDVDPVMREAEAHMIEQRGEPLPAGNGAKPEVMAAALLIAQEDERRRLARELHDEFNQKLALLELTVQGLENRIPSDEVRRQLVDIRRQVGELSDDLRRIAYQLHPSMLDDLGLVPALQQFCEEFTSHEGIQAQFTHRDVPGDLPGSVRLALFRVAQEGLRNVAKHSAAKRAFVSLAGSDSKLELTIRDGGIGFNIDDLPHKGLGMVSMRERLQLVGGSIEWKSRPGDGTTVTARVPLRK
jgi:two-component system CheB/CheR fusion protein